MRKVSLGERPSFPSSLVRLAIPPARDPYPLSRVPRPLLHVPIRESFSGLSRMTCMSISSNPSEVIPICVSASEPSLSPLEDAFGADIDFAQAMKVYSFEESTGSAAFDTQHRQTARPGGFMGLILETRKIDNIAIK